MQDISCQCNLYLQDISCRVRNVAALDMRRCRVTSNPVVRHRTRRWEIEAGDPSVSLDQILRALVASGASRREIQETLASGYPG